MNSNSIALLAFALPLMTLACGSSEARDGRDGLQGVQGSVGPAGEDGAPGATGATGPAGIAGLDGAAGATGPEGPKGDTGDVGAIGPTGPTGPAGGASAPDVAVEACDKVYTLDGFDTLYAEHLYPGKTAADLARVRVLSGLAVGKAPAGYLYSFAAPWIADGKVGVLCGYQQQGPYADVTFVLQ